MLKDLPIYKNYKKNPYEYENNFFILKHIHTYLYICAHINTTINGYQLLCSNKQPPPLKATPLAAITAECKSLTFHCKKNIKK